MSSRINGRRRTDPKPCPTCSMKLEQLETYKLMIDLLTAQLSKYQVPLCLTTRTPVAECQCPICKERRPTNAA